MGSVGFIGLGNIGAPIAFHLVDWPGGLVVFDVRAEACLPHAEKGADVAGSVAEVAERCDVVSVMVLDDAQVRDVVTTLAPHLKPGAVVAVHSTIAVSTAIEMGEVVARQGAHLVDAPVSGGAVGAAERRLAVMVGGERAAYEQCSEVFKRWAELVLHTGPVGSGTRAKIARALLMFVGYAAAAEAQRLAEAAQIDLRTLSAIVRQSDAVTGGVSAIMFRDTTAAVALDDPLRGILEHTYALGAKDLALATELADELGVAVPFTRLAATSLAAGLGLVAE
jgi:3-hydroxyisobutyrate dehydrogenase-like beta-hydroxyacid dehydrogenase